MASTGISALNTIMSASFIRLKPLPSRAQGTCKVELRKVKIGKDLGSSLEIVQGLSPDDRVILNPSPSLATGQIVRIR